MKRFLSIILAVMLAASMCVSCAKPQKNPLEGTSDKLVLYVYAYEYDSMTKRAVDIFKMENRDVDVEIKEFLGADNPEEAYEDYKENLKTALAAGSGPDIVIWYSNIFDDPYKTMESGVFDDLNLYISNDEDFSLSDYNEKVLEAGVIKGKRYTIPLGYHFPLLITTETNY